MKGMDITDLEKLKQKICIIIRGISGSGKSTMARYLAGAFDATVVSADDYHINQDGEYVFLKENIPAAHGECKRKFREAVGEGKAVVVDNTNVCRKEWEYYSSYAGERGYSILILPLYMGGATVEELVERNIHGVQREVIERQLKRWRW